MDNIRSDEQLDERLPWHKPQVQQFIVTQATSVGQKDTSTEDMVN
jgi:hypothetical protein